MAQKKATVFILNVANSMSKDFSTALSVITDNIEEKVLSGRKTDMVAVVLAGTPETNNILNDRTPGQYERVTSMCPISQPLVDLLRSIQNLSTSSEDVSPADVFDAVIVATEMIREHCRHLKYEKRIILITDNQDKIDWLDLEDVAAILRDLATQLLVIGTDHNRLQDPDCPDNIAENYKNWQLLIDKADTNGEVLSLEEAYHYTQVDSVKEVRPTPAFRGYLYIGNPHEKSHVVGISIHMYLRTKTIPLPSGHKYSMQSTGATHNVVSDTVYKFDADAAASNSLSVDKGDEKIIDNKDRLEQAFRFGKTAILISRDEVVSNKFTSKRELTVIGFIDQDNLKRHYMYSNAYILTAGSYSTSQSALALAAFGKALYEEHSCAIVRYVQKDDGRPRIGVLQPYDRQGEEDVEYLLQYFDLPFAEDIRDYKFRSIVDPKSTDPKCVQLMDNLIDSMDLKTVDEEGNYLTPEESFNPILWRFNKAIKNRALNPDAPIPEIKDSHKPQLELYEGFKEKASVYSEQLARALEVRKVVDKGKGKGKKRYSTINDVADPENAVNIDDILGNIKSTQDGPIYTPLTPKETSSKVSFSNNDVDTVGLITPVEDFHALLNKQSEVDMVDIAIQKMTIAIHKFLTISFGNQHFPIVITCLKELRSVAKKEDAAVSYNKHIREIKQWCNPSNKSSTRYELWEALKQEKLGLITNQECLDTDNADTTEEVAEKFWNTDEEAPAVSDKTTKDESGQDEQMDDVFDPDDLDNMI